MTTLAVERFADPSRRCDSGVRDRAPSGFEVVDLAGVADHAVEVGRDLAPEPRVQFVVGRALAGAAARHEVRLVHRRQGRGRVDGAATAGHELAHNAAVPGG